MEKFTFIISAGESIEIFQVDAENEDFAFSNFLSTKSHVFEWDDCFVRIRGCVNVWSTTGVRLEDELGCSVFFIKTV